MRGLAKNADISLEAAAARISVDFPLGWTDEPDDVAALGLFLDSPRTSVVIGQSIAIGAAAKKRMAS